MIIKTSVLQDKPDRYDGLWLSVSKSKTFDQCKAKYRYCYIEHLPRKQWPHQIFGQFAHEVLENYHKMQIEGSSLPLNKIMTECFKISAENFKDQITLDQKKELWLMLNNYLKQHAKDCEDGSNPDVIDVEPGFYVDINGEILLNGYIDRIQLDNDGILHVADYKTTKNKKYLIGDYFQLLTYAYVMCLQDPDLQQVRTSYILLKHNFSSITKLYNRDQIVEPIGKKFLEYKEKISAEKLWRPNTSGLCNFCDYQDVCSAGKDFSNKKLNVKYGVFDW